MPGGDNVGPPPAVRGGRLHGERAGSGPGGQCVCPTCGEKVAHQIATPCDRLSCPKCGHKMMRV